VVSALEILRAHVEAYLNGARALSKIEEALHVRNESGENYLDDAALMTRLHEALLSLHGHCQYLPMTATLVQRLALAVKNPDDGAHFTKETCNYPRCLAAIQSRLEDELSLALFFRLPPEKKRYFDEPRHGWEEIIDRFPNAVVDVEEMSKCFALSRYAAAVFHSVQVVEAALYELGTFLGVSDHESGWGSVKRELERIAVKQKFGERNKLHQKHFSFIEQMHAVTEALNSAWRNKVSHTRGRLILMTSDFGPDVAEEIMISSRSFMRRLATELPQREIS
jgi:hypothetical protein